MEGIILFIIMLGIIVTAIFIFNFQGNSIEQIYPGIVFYKAIFNQPERSTIHDFSAYDKYGIIQIIECYKESAIDYDLAHAQSDESKARLKKLKSLYEDENELNAIINKKISDQIPLVYCNQKVVMYKNGIIKWILEDE